MIVILGDSHFGDLRTNEEEFQALFREWIDFLKERDIDELILMGDMLDLCYSGVNQVVDSIKNYEDFKNYTNYKINPHFHLFEKLLTLSDRIIYLIGNHDALLASKIFGDNYLIRLAEDKPLHKRLDNMEVYYPFYEKKQGNRNLLFIHGHQINFIQNLNLPLALFRNLQFIETCSKVFWSTGNLFWEKIDDICSSLTYPEKSKLKDKIRKAACDMVDKKALNLQKEVTNVLEKVDHSLLAQTIASLKVALPFKVDEEEIFYKLNSCIRYWGKHKKIDCLFFGHIHKAFLFRKEGQIIVNSGKLGDWIELSEGKIKVKSKWMPFP
jgi:UDP-2,3-diacylglucosamine pyrophosphatase LpxH